MFCDQRKIWHGQGIVRENCRLADETFRLSIEIIPNSAESFPEVQAGQFIMLRLMQGNDPLLGRPLAIYRVDKLEQSTLVEVVYIVVGKMTRRLSAVRPNETLNLWAPLGQGFKVYPDQHTIMVAGGIGQTPFLIHAGQLSRRTLIYGARTKSRLACVEDFERLGVDVEIATDDGSSGYHGPVTDLIRKVYKPGEPTRLICCGPHPMLKAAFLVAQELNLPCDVSLETPMGCGLGICFGCVVRYRNEDDHHSESSETWDYKRTCIDGPAFDAYRLCWD